MRRSNLLAVGGLGLANQVRWAHRTRPEPLPPRPSGSTTVRMRDGVELHSQVGGVLTAATTVVMTHGFLARSLEFDQQWQSLARRVRLVRYDHRNHGRSDHSTRSLSVEQLGDDLAAVIEQLAPTGDLVLVGHSMGGMTVLALAEHHPEVLSRVKGVALLATERATSSRGTASRTQPA